MHSDVLSMFIEWKDAFLVGVEVVYWQQTVGRGLKARYINRAFKKTTSNDNINMNGVFYLLNK